MHKSSNRVWVFSDDRWHLLSLLLKSAVLHEDLQILLSEFFIDSVLVCSLLMDLHQRFCDVHCLFLLQRVRHNLLFLLTHTRHVLHALFDSEYVQVIIEVYLCLGYLSFKEFLGLRKLLKSYLTLLERLIDLSVWIHSESKLTPIVHQFLSHVRIDYIRRWLFVVSWTVFCS